MRSSLALLATVLLPTLLPAAVVPIQAQPFDLADVRLFDSPFSHAMELDRQYLLTLPPGRLVHNFRLNAGLPSSAQPLGGWEKPDSEVRGHFTGHYLSAAAMMCRNTHDEQLKSNAAAVVAALADCQAKFPSGYLSAFPESFFDRLESDGKVWVPWYTMHKVYAGLLDQYTLAGNKQALDVLLKAIAWADARTAKLSDVQMQKALDVEHGGMNEVLANLYAVTHDPKHLALAQRFNHHQVLDPLTRNEDHLDGLHANTQFPKVIGLARQYQLTGDAPSHTAAAFFWQAVTHDRSYVTGGNSDGEHFSPKSHLSRALGPATTETCNSYNMLRLTQLLYQTDPNPQYIDYYERTLYNHILASQNPQTGMPLYYLPLRNGSARGDGKPFGFSTPFDSFWCCTGTGVENPARYPAAIYAHHDADSLYVNLFIPSELTWPDAGVKVRQETTFPESPATTLMVGIDNGKAADFTLHLRRPYWATTSFAITLNGKPLTIDAAPGSYVHIKRTWHPADTLVVTMPMTLRTESFKDDPHRLALMYGPLVLSADTTHNDSTAAAITTDPSHLPELLRPVADKPLTFTASADTFRQDFMPTARPVTFHPFYNNFDSPYVVYWDATTPDAWEKRIRDHDAALARDKDLAARTIDQIEFTPDSEKSHHLTGDHSRTGQHLDRHWRDAFEGGFFSFDLNVFPDHPNVLSSTYWGAEGGPRQFTIFVDDQPLATESLSNKWNDDQFHDQTYPIPPELTKGKTSIHVTFKALPNNLAGGSFGCRTLRPAAETPAP